MALPWHYKFDRGSKKKTTYIHTVRYVSIQDLAGMLCRCIFRLWLGQRWLGKPREYDVSNGLCDSILWVSDRLVQQAAKTEVALSTTEAAYIALSQSMREVIPIIHLMDKLKPLIDFYNPTPEICCKLFEDNRSCIIVAESACLLRKRNTSRSNTTIFVNSWKRDQYKYILYRQESNSPTFSRSRSMNLNSSIWELCF